MHIKYIFACRYFYYMFIPVVLQVHMFYFLNFINNRVLRSFNDVSLAVFDFFFPFNSIF